MPKKIPQKKISNTQTATWRFGLIFIALLVWMGAIGVRLFNLQVKEHETWLNRALSQRRDEIKQKPLRGNILDRQERELAISTEVSSLFADPSAITNVDTTAYSLANLLNQSPRQLAKQLREAKESGKQFMWLARKLESETAEKIKNLGLEGLFFRKEQKRYYPHGSLASSVIGFSNLEDVGQAGVELTLDKELKGEPGESWVERDRLGRIYEISDTKSQTVHNVVLTIDQNIQYRAEQALAAGIEAAKAKSGTAVVIDPKTGEILAMASLPTFNPNKLNDFKPELLANKAVQNFYDPGSTFKLVTYSAALEEKLVNPNETIDCSRGFVEIAGHRIEDSHKAGVLSLGEALAYSSNVAAITIGQRLGKNKLYDYIRRFGYGEATGIELPAETSGILRDPKKWSEQSLGSISIGYEIGASLLQTASAFATIANNGVRIAPHLVKEIRETNGTIISRATPEKSQVVSPDTAKTMRQMLQKVTLSGTGKRAQVNGYSVGGKTGTAWKFDSKSKSYAENKLASSFVGFAPVDNPSVVIAVLIDEPRVALGNGGDVAAPVFSAIAGQILPEMQVLPDTEIKEDDQNLLAENKLKDDKQQPKRSSFIKFDETDKNKTPETAKKETKAKPENVERIKVEPNKSKTVEKQTVKMQPKPNEKSEYLDKKGATQTPNESASKNKIRNVSTKSDK